MPWRRLACCRGFWLRVGLWKQGGPTLGLGRLLAHQAGPWRMMHELAPGLWCFWGYEGAHGLITFGTCEEEGGHVSFDCMVCADALKPVNTSVCCSSQACAEPGGSLQHRALAGTAEVRIAAPRFLAPAPIPFKCVPDAMQHRCTVQSASTNKKMKVRLR